MADAMNNYSRLQRTWNNSQEISTGTSSGESLEFKYSKVSFYFLILFCTTFGNAMVLYVICTSKRMKSASHLLIFNLAICDLFTPLISIPFDFALEENGYVWLYGHFMCKILSPAATFSTTASSLTLAAISLDRYRLLMHPFKRKLGSNQIKFMILGIYIFSALAVSPYTYGLYVADGSCQEQWPIFLYRQLYTMALFLFQYALPLSFMTVMYTLAILNLYSTSNKMKTSSIRSDIRNKINTNEKDKRGFNQLKSTFKRRNSKVEENPNIRATKMFMTVVAVFAVFMFPNQFLWLWADFGSGAEQPHFGQTAIICWLFTYTNSVVNPIIFGIFSKEFRVGFIGVFRLLFCCNRQDLPDRCVKCKCQTKTDSATNEILSERERKTTMAWDSNDTLKNYSYGYGSVIDTKGDSVDKESLEYTNIGTRSFDKDCPLINSNTSLSRLTQGLQDVKGMRKDFIQFPADTLVGGVNKGALPSCVIPVLDSNAIALLHDLPETNC